MLLALVSASMRMPFQRGAGHAVIVAPAAPGSIGDHAMLTVLCERLRGPKVLLSFGSGPHSLECMPQTHVEYIAELFEGSVVGSARTAIRVGRILRGARAFAVIGADIMDGGYSPWRSELRFGLARVASKRMPSSVLNMSWNASPARRALAAVKKAKGVRIVARDSVSAGRLRRDGSVAVEESADLGFLYERTAAPESDLQSWLERCRSDGRRVVGVNLNAAVAAAETLIDVVLPSCLWLLDNDYSLLLISHDNRNRATGDFALLQRLQDRLASAGDTMLWQATGADTVSWVVRRVDFVISCRMHLIVLASVAGVPAIGFEYQGKMTGLYADHLGSPDLLLGSAELDGELLLRKVRRLATERDQLAAALSQRLPSWRELAERNRCL